MQVLTLLSYSKRIDEGLTEEDCWRLMQQLVDALAHMESMGIVSLYDHPRGSSLLTQACSL